MIDFEKIKKDNIRRFGEETKHLEYLGNMYADSTHFIYEFLQNAEDAEATAIRFCLYEDRFEVFHNGREFTENDVVAICGIKDNQEKQESSSTIGKFGIGFKSVYAYTETPQIHSGDNHFKIEHFVRPQAIDPIEIAKEWTTFFVLPFNAKEIERDFGKKIGARLQNLGARVLLFLSSLETIEFTDTTTNFEGKYFRKKSTKDTFTIATVEGYDNAKEVKESWVLECEDTDQLQKITFAFLVDTDSDILKIVPAEETYISVFFPTEKESHLGFLVNVPFDTTPARDNIKRNDTNDNCVQRVISLFEEVLSKFKQENLVDIGFLQTLPIQRSHSYPQDWVFLPLYNRIKEILTTEEYLPTNTAGYTSGKNGKLARGEALWELLPSNILKQLYGSDENISWISENITEYKARELHGFLTDELNIDEIRPENALAKMDEGFFQKQSDEWLLQLYAYLLEKQSNWIEQINKSPYHLRKIPLIRLRDNSHCKAFIHDDCKIPTAHIFAGEEDGLKYAKESIANDPVGKEFLKKLGYEKPDITDTVIKKVLERYKQESSLIPETYQEDLKKIEEAFNTDSNTKKEAIVKELKNHYWVLGENAASGEIKLRKPEDIFSNLTEEYLEYFLGNPGINWICEGHIFSSQLLNSIDTKRVVLLHWNDLGKDENGHRRLVEESSNYQRGLNNFALFATIDGLEFASRNPSNKKSAYIWNHLLIDNWKRHILGEVESSSTKKYARSNTERKLSNIGELLTQKSWLPDQEGTFHKPSKLRLDDLPESFRRDRELAEMLGMKASISDEKVQNFLDEADIPKEKWDLIQTISDEEMKLIQKHRQQSKELQENIPDDDFNFSESLEGAFNTNGMTELKQEILDDEEYDDDSLPNESRRREKESVALSESIKNEPKKNERYKTSIRKMLETPDSTVKNELNTLYHGKCQICGETFPKVNGQPFFVVSYLIKRNEKQFLDNTGNALCLCADHFAMMEHGAKSSDGNNEEIILKQDLSSEEGVSIPFELCGKPVEIRYKKKHLISLQELIKVAKK